MTRLHHSPICLCIAALTSLSSAFSAPEPAPLWSVGKFDGLPTEFSPSEGAKKPVSLKAGVDKMDVVGWPGQTAGFINVGKAPYLTVTFSVAKDGDYTLKLSIADAKPTPKDLVVWLDGQEVFKEPLRGLSSGVEDNNLQYRENIVLKLKAGEHKIGLGAFETGAVKAGNYYVLDALALVPGNVPLVYEVKTTEPENWEAKDYSDPFASRWEARDFTVRLTDIQPGDYDLQLNFEEDEVFKAGERVFDVSVDGKQALKGVDIIGEVGKPFQKMTKMIPVKVGANGVLDVNFHTAKGLKAIVNELKLLKGKEVVFRNNCGFIPGASLVLATPATIDGRTKGGKFILGMDEEDSDEEEAGGEMGAGKGSRFTGVNIINNGDFEDPMGEDGYPKGWNDSELVSPSGRKTKPLDFTKPRYWKQGEGKLALDTEVKHGGKASVRISQTKQMFGISQYRFSKGWTDMDWTKPYELVAWVRADNATGENNLRIDWTSYVEHSKTRYLGAQNFPIPNGTYDWKEIRITVTPPPGASALSAAITSENNSGTIWVDDMSVDGFGARAIEVIASQGGYVPRGVKEAIVLTKEDYPKGSFSLVPAGGGKPAMQGELEKVGFFESYGRYVWKATFTEFSTPGKYQVEATFPGVAPDKSFAFVIDPKLYFDIAKLNVEYFRVIQANIAVPGWHGADNLDDARVRNERFNTKEPGALTGPHVPAQGNYYDAGDFSKKPMGAMVAVALAELDTQWKDGDQKYGLLPSDPMSIGLHGAVFFKNTARADGGFYGTVLRHDKVSMDPVSMTDNVPNTPDDGMLLANRQPGIPYALARFAYLLNKRDPKQAMEYARLADHALTPMIRYWDNFGGDQASDYQKLVFAPWVAGAAINLNLLMPERTDLKAEADKRMREIIPLVNKRVYEDKMYLLTTISTHNGVDLCHEFGFALAMLDFIEAYPTDPLVPEIKQSLTGFIDKGLIPATQTNPFGRLGEITQDQKNARPYLSPRYYDSAAFGAAYIMARAAIDLNQPQWLAPAERQIQWGIGFNPRAVSFCMGVGEKFAAVRTHLGVGEHMDCEIPGGVNKGFSFTTGRRGLADGYMTFSGVHDQVRDGLRPAGQEYWQIITAYFLLAAQELNKAFEHFEPKGTASASNP